MKKISTWLVAIITSLVSLLAMCVYDYLLSLVGHFLEKVPFLTEIICFAGEILDLGLTAIVAIYMASFIWKIGHSVIKKINKKHTEFEDSPIHTINYLFFVVFLGVSIFFGIKFALLIGDTVTYYTADFQGFNKILMFFKAIKDTFGFVCSKNAILYSIGYNSLFLSIINGFFAENVD